MSNSFWSDHVVEPKRIFRWQLRLNSVPAWTIKECKKPSFTQTKAQHQYLNHTFNFPGRIEWQEMPVTLVDPINPDIAATLMDIMTRSGYRFPESSLNTSTVSKKRAVEALGNVEIVQLDAGPGGLEEATPIEIWRLKNAWLKDFDNATLNYSEDGLVEIKTVIVYDYAVPILTGQPATLS